MAAPSNVPVEVRVVLPAVRLRHQHPHVLAEEFAGVGATGHSCGMLGHMGVDSSCRSVLGLRLEVRG